MSLRKAIADATRVKKGVRFGDESDDEPVQEVKVAEPKESFPNISIMAGDYAGNILGLRVMPPRFSQTKDDSQFDENELSVSEDEDMDEDDEEHASDTKAKLLRMLAAKKGVAPTKQRVDKSMTSASFVASVSGELHAGAVTTITAGGRYIVTGGHDECVKMCKRHGENKVKEFGSLHRHSCGVTASAMMSSGQLLLTGGEDGTICAWANTNWDCVAVLKNHSNTVLSIAMHPTAPLALSVGKDNRLIMWDLRPHSIRMVTASILPKVKPQWGSLPQVPISILFSPAGDYYTVAYNRNLQIYNAKGPHAGRVARIFEDPDIKILSQTYLDGHRVALGADNHSVYIVDVTTAKLVSELKGEHKNRVRFVEALDTFHSRFLLDHYTNDPMPSNGPDSKQSSHFLVSADTDGHVVLWKVDMAVTTTTVTHSLVRAEKKAPKFMRRGEDSDDDEDDVEDEEDEEEIAARATTEEIEEDDTIVSARALCNMNTASRLMCMTISYPFYGNVGTDYVDMKPVNERTSARELRMGDDEFDMPRKRKQRDEEGGRDKKLRRGADEKPMRGGKFSKGGDRDDKGKGKFGAKGGDDAKGGRGGKFAGKGGDKEDKFSKNRKFGGPNTDNGRGARYEDKADKQDRGDKSRKSAPAGKGPQDRIARRTAEGKAAVGTNKSRKIGNFKGAQRPPRGKKRF